MNCTLTPNDGPNLAAKTCICNQKLFDDPTSSLGSAPWGPCEWCYPFWEFWPWPSQCSDDAVWCCNTLEFNIRYACICTQVSWANQQNFCWQRHEEVQAFRGRMGPCSTAVQCIGSTLCWSINLFPLLTFLQIFKDATLFFSRSTPNLTTVIPAMDHIDTHLATAGQNVNYSPAIHTSLALGKAHLNKYYNMTNHSEVYRIAMSECSPPDHFFQSQLCWTVLHPWHKLQYFHDTNWDAAWITTVTAIVRNEFVHTYAELPIVDDVTVIHTMNVRPIWYLLPLLKLTKVHFLDCY